jgi:hypothetical protein
MKPAFCLALLALAAAGTIAAEETSAPLANAKKELQQLQKDEAAKKSGEGDAGLKGALPSLNAPVPGQSALDLPFASPSAQSTEKNRAEAARNWLINGVDQFDRHPSRPGRDGRGKTEFSDDDESLFDRADPNYLLRAYDKQQKDNFKDGFKANRRLTGMTAPASSDPLNPFLQNWLAGSPVRGPILDMLKRKDGSGPAGDGFETRDGRVGLGAGGSTNARVPAGANGGLEPTGSATSPNPYLQALAAPPLHDTARVSGSMAVPGGGNVLLPGQSFAKPSTTYGLPADTQPARADSFKPPPSKTEDDKKYFRQLKRF